MFRRRLAAVVALATFALVLSPAPAHAAVEGRIRGISHHHPNANYSWVAARVKATEGAQVQAHLAGPAVAGDASLQCRARRDQNGKVLVVWKIQQAGRYTVHLTATRDGSQDTATKSYDVPNPPSPAWGPFHFPKEAGCHKGWPRR